jgi:hypothetical protein
VDEDVCPVCEHPSDLHPGVNPWLNVCGICISEEDHGERAYEDMCIRQPEAASQPLPSGRLRTRVSRHPLHGHRVYIEDWQRQRWATVVPKIKTRLGAEQVAAAVDVDLACMNLATLREKYLDQPR